MASSGLIAIIGSALGYAMQVPQSGTAFLFIEECIGALMLCTGAYGLVRFAQVRLQEAATPFPTRPPN